MAGLFEHLVYNNLIGIFGNNLILFVLFSLTILFLIVLAMRIPFIVSAPLFMMAFIIVGYTFGGKQNIVLLIAGLSVGIGIAYFIYSLWTGR